MTKLTAEELSTTYLNLADASMNAKALYATDEFFAPKERMLAPTEPEWKEDVYDDNGKWMDGWESRRKREHGHDYCIVRLVARGTIKAIDIDTRYFTGNYPPIGSVDACHQKTDPDDETRWLEIVPPNPLSGNSHNIFETKSSKTFTHLRLNIFPDGGVARLRVYGEKT